MSSLNDAFWNDKEEYVKAALNTLGSAGLPISLNKSCEHLADYIIDSYDNTTSLFVYKTVWCRKIAQVLNDLNIKYRSTKPKWEYIAMSIIDKRLGLRSYPLQVTRSTYINSSYPSPITITVTAAAAAATAVSSSSESSNTTKQLKLCSDDKEKIKNLYDSLDESKMWKLSTGTIVEEKMKDFALNCVY